MNLPDVMSFGPATVTERLKPAFDNEEELKKAFGTQLGTGKQAFDAACEVFKNETNKALYASQHWLNDPIVIAAKEFYIKTVHNAGTLLDADQLAAKLLHMADEKNASNTFYLLEGKDRLKALELYAKVKGFDKSGDAHISNNITFKQMVVKFVSPKKEEKIIDQLPDSVPQISNNKSNVKLKLVS